jgi:hypothetical protein
MKHPSSVKEGRAVKCANCRNEINSGALVCPFCHTDPGVVGSQPYAGLEHINNPGPYDPEITLGVLGTIFLPVLPPAGFILWGMAGLSLVAKWCKGRKAK